MNELERQNVIDRLKTYRCDLNELLDFVGNKPDLTREEKMRAHALMKTLKGKLGEDYKGGSTVSGQAKMNEYEKAYFQPAVHGASTQIRVRWNSDPTSSRWYSELYAALVDINFSLDDLERQDT